MRRNQRSGLGKHRGVDFDKINADASDTPLWVSFVPLVVFLLICGVIAWGLLSGTLNK